jgi:lipid-A-disaccharide synthase
MPERTRNIFISAGEESGDLQGANLVRALKGLRPQLAFRGLGGKKMRAEGVETLSDIGQMGGIGLTGVLGGFFHHWRVYRALADDLRRGKYCAAILIHYPMFNLLLAKVCRKAGVPVFFFIGPQVWAWRKGRLKEIRKTVDKMFVILPFEEPIYRQAGIDVEFVGHPFIEQARPTQSREEARREFGLQPGVKTVGLLPGSRKSEIDRLLPVMLRAAGKLKAALGQCQFLLPIADSIPPEYIHARLQGAPVAVRTVVGKTYDVMNACDFLFCCSGSATLEAGLIGCPMVIIYRFNPITFWFGRRLVHIKYFGLINIVAGEELAPELLQGEVTPERMVHEALAILTQPERERALRQQLAQVRQSLGPPGVAGRLADRILAHLGPIAADPAHEKISL